MVRLRSVAVLVLLYALPAALPAQQPDAPPAPDATPRDSAPLLAPVFLDPGHWVYDALRRLSVASAAPKLSDPAVAPIALEHARVVLDRSATLLVEAGRHALAAQAREYLRLLEAEAPREPSALTLHIRGGWASAAGEALGGDGYCRGGETFCETEAGDWQGAVPLRDAAAPVVAVRGFGHLAPWLAWSVDGGHAADEWRLISASLAATAGPFDVWAGRRRLHYGVGRSGGIVLGTGVNEVAGVAFRTQYDFEGVGIHVREPFRFPGLLAFLGEGRVEMVAGRLPRKGQVRHPYAIFGRLSTTPFSPRVMLGVNRGAIFGGEGIPITVGRMAGLLVGMHGGEVGEFENQVFSAIARYRPPLGALPLEAYLELGMDDTSGAIRDVPAYVAGVDIGPLPWLPALSLGLERTSYAQSCCGNTIWYRNFFYRGSWTDDGRLIAHPLGGHGRELLGHARLDLPAAGLLVRGEAFVRTRGHENLFASERQGRSRGGMVGVEYRLHAGTSLRVDGLVERASGWNMHRFTAMLSHPLVRRP